MEHWLWIILAALCSGIMSEDTISPRQDKVRKREGESVTLTCDYETTYVGVYLLWYRHDSDLLAPQFILRKGAKGSDDEDIPDKRYKSQTTDTTTKLTISRLTLADTALYYCALQTYDTYLGTGGYVIFGKAIHLTVQMRDVTPVEPDLFILSPLQSENQVSAEKPGPEVCLATGFRPKEVDMVLNNSLTLKTTNAVLSLKMKTYVYAGFSDWAIESCKLHNWPAIEKETPEDKCEKKEHIVASPPQEVEICADPRPDKAKLNLFLVLLNGVRVLFIKAVSFSTILTIKAMLF